MNKVVDALVSKGIVCRTLLRINTSELHTRKKIACFLGVDEKARYLSVWHRLSNNRINEEEAHYLFMLLERLENLRNHRVLRNVIMTKSPVSSRADKLFREKGWRIINVLM